MSSTLGKFISWFHSSKDETVASHGTNEEHEPWGLSVLEEGSGPVIDIVAIHGLNGHREQTWTASNGVLWLKDLLPEKIPEARVVVYGYDSRTHSLEANLSTESIEGHAQEFLRALTAFRDETVTTRRPTIFVAHSLGGIVLKSALILSGLTNAKHLEDQGAIKISTAGILFLGTPHQGSPGVSLAQSLGRLASVYYYTNDTVLAMLEQHSTWLMGQSEHFKGLSTGFDIRYFFESRETYIKGGKRLQIVPKWSAALPGAVNAEIIPIQKDHISMVKFTSAEDNDFTTIAGTIRRMMKTSEDRVTRNWTAWDSSQTVLSIETVRETFEKSDFRIPSNLPLRNESFVGRKELLAWMEQQLSTPDSKKTIVLFGTGGVGKSQLALQYAWKHKAKYTTVLVFNAKSLPALRTSYQEVATELVQYYAGLLPPGQIPYGLIAEHLHLRGLIDHEGRLISQEKSLDCIVQAVKSWLSTDTNDRWLLVYDGYDDLDSFKLLDYLPRARGGGIVITTQRRDMSWTAGSPKEVPCFSDHESLELLSQRLQTPLESSAMDDVGMIVKKLGNLPQAVDHAGAYMFAENITIPYYLTIFNTRLADLLKQQPPAFATQYNESVYATVGTSFTKLETKKQSSAEMLILLSCCSNIDIPTRLLQKGLQRSLGETESAMSVLLHYSLISRQRNDSYSIHPLVQFWARDHPDTEQKKQIACQAVRLVALAIRREGKYTGTKEDLIFERRVRMHVEAVHANVLELWESEALSDVDASHWKDFGAYYQAHGQYTKAETLYTVTLKSAEHLSYPANKAILPLVLNLAKLYRQQSQLVPARDLYQRYLKDIEQHSGLASTEAARLQIGLGVAYHELHKFPEAEKLYDEGTKTLISLLGEDHPETLSAMDNLASTYLRLKQYEKAETLYNKILQDIPGPDDHSTSRTMQNLGVLYQKQGQYEKAQNLFSTSLELRTNSLGEEHPSTLRTLSNVARVHDHQKQYGPAQDLYAAVIAGRTKTLGENHLDTLRSTHDLAIVCLHDGQFHRSQELLESALERLGSDSDTSGESLTKNVKKLLLRVRDSIKAAEAEARENARSYAPTPVLDLRLVRIDSNPWRYP